MQQEHNEIKEAANALGRDWGITFDPGFTKEAIIDKLALKLASVAEEGPEPFFQLMYRLDISERKLNEAMHDKNVIREIAELVYNRQLQKTRSREYYKNNKPGEDAGELKW